MSTEMTSDKINPDLLYEGYLWMSNADSPIVYDYDRPVDMTLFRGTNPFVREGYLYSREAKISLTIKFVDGQYLIREHEVTEKQEYDELSFVSHRMEGAPLLKFRRYWRMAQDPACLGMETQVFDRMVFVGFEKKQ